MLWITFYHQSQRYRRSLKLEDTNKNRKYANDELIPELKYKLKHGKFFENEEETKVVPTVEQFSKVSFEIHKNNRRSFTQDNYKRIYELHIRPYFGNKKIDLIKASQIAMWQNKLLEKLSSKRVKSVRTVFNTFFDDAMRDEIIVKNPFALVKGPKQEDIRDKIPFTVEEIYQILDHISDSMKAFFAIGFFTGMRTGEIIGLKWIDVNFDERIIQVRRSRRQGVESVPKTKNSIRDVEIIDALMPYLINHRERAKDEAVYIFETFKKEPFNTCAKIAEWYWKPTLKALGIKYRNLYQMRHSFASMMISEGEDILWVSSMLGHKDSSMTLEKYARYIKRQDRKRATFLKVNAG